MRMTIFTATAAFIILVAAGCGSDAPPTAPVTGTVTYKGAPLKEATISFMPKDGRPGYGKIVDGSIKDVMTLEPGDGAPVGPSQVTIQAAQGGGDMYAEQKSLIPDRYGSPEKSGLTADIKADGPNELKFELTD